MKHEEMPSVYVNHADAMITVDGFKLILSEASGEGTVTTYPRAVYFMSIRTANGLRQMMNELAPHLKNQNAVQEKK